MSSMSHDGPSQEPMSRRARSLGTSCRLAARMSARARKGDGPGVRGRTRSPARSRRRMPCQANATHAPAAGTSTQASGSSEAMGAKTQAGASRQDGGSASVGTGSLSEPQVWMRPANVSTLVKTGPRRSGAVATVTPASLMRSSSRRACRFLVQAQHDAGPQAEAGQGQCAEGHATAEHPASWVLVAQVARGGSDHHHIRCLHPASLPFRIPAGSSPIRSGPCLSRRRVRDHRSLYSDS